MCCIGIELLRWRSISALSLAARRADVRAPGNQAASSVSELPALTTRAKASGELRQVASIFREPASSRGRGGYDGGA